MNIIKLFVLLLSAEGRGLRRNRRDLSSQNRMANNMFLQEIALRNGQKQDQLSYYRMLHNYLSKQQRSKNTVDFLNHVEGQLERL